MTTILSIWYFLPSLFPPMSHSLLNLLSPLSISQSHILLYYFCFSFKFYLELSLFIFPTINFFSSSFKAMNPSMSILEKKSLQLPRYAQVKSSNWLNFIYFFFYKSNFILEKFCLVIFYFINKSTFFFNFIIFIL